MKARCFNSKDPDYANYGGRGIAVCSRWINSFENFFIDVGAKPFPKSKYSLDRIIVNGDYEPKNCRWATAKEQNDNQRRNQAFQQLVQLEKVSGMTIEMLIASYASLGN
jgi:hypothetical protein